jgi:hypothetical protein
MKHLLIKDPTLQKPKELNIIKKKKPWHYAIQKER